MSDLILNVRQIGSYPNRAVPLPTDTALIQVGGVGGAYYSLELANLPAVWETPGSQYAVGVPLPGNASASGIMASQVTTLPGCTQGFNWYATTAGQSYLANGPAQRSCLNPDGSLVISNAPTGGSAGAQVTNWTPAFTLQWNGTILQPLGATVDLGRNATGPLEAVPLQQLQSSIANTVNSFNGRIGTVTLTLADITGAGGAPIASPAFSGNPTAPTQPQTDSSANLATTLYVTTQVNLSRQNSVLSFNGRTGAIELSPTDLTQSNGILTTGGTFTGNVSAPTQAPGTNTTLVATTAFVTAAVAAAVVSFNGRTGAITLTTADITGAGGAPLNSPAFSGTPNAPTANPGTSTSQLATTAFVMAAVTSATTGVVSWNTRTGAVTMTATDISNAGGALANNAALTGVPTAPTATGGTNTTQIATTAFVEQAVAAATVGVASFNGRTGTVTLLAGDVTGVGGALLASPTFTGVPAAPTPTAGNNSTQIATTAFVQSTIAAGTVTSFNDRTGVVTLTNNDISAAGGLSNPNASMTGVPTAPTAIAGTNTTQVATTQFVTSAISVLPAGITVSTTAPSSPKSGAGWFNLNDGQTYIWTGSTWAIAVNPPMPNLSGYLQLSGGLMTSPGNLSFPLSGASNGTIFFNAQMVSGNPTTIAAGPSGMINLTSTGMLIGVTPVQTAGQTMTTINGPLIDPRGNVGLGILPPTTAALTDPAQGGQIFGKVADFNNFGVNAYFDGTNWRRSNATIIPAIISASGTYLAFYNAATGAVGSTFTPSIVATMDTGGNFTATGNATVATGVTYSGLTPTHSFGFTWGGGGPGLGITCYVDATAQGLMVRTGTSTASSLTAIDLQGLNGAVPSVVWYYNGGSITVAVNFSDRRLKSNVVPAHVDALGLINRIKIYDADIDNPLPGGGTQHWDCSLIADELDEVIPRARVGATGEAGSYDTINQLPIVCTLIRAVQQLAAEVAALKGAPA